MVDCTKYTVKYSFITIGGETIIIHNMQNMQEVQRPCCQRGQETNQMITE